MLLGVGSAPSWPVLTCISGCRSRLCLCLPQMAMKFPTKPSSTASSPHSRRLLRYPLTTTVSAVGNAKFVVETETSVKFPKEVRVPGCSEPLVLLGTGYREKVFAIIGVKVYAAGFYAEPTIVDGISAEKIKLSLEVLEDSSLCRSIFKAPQVKSLMIMLVRDIDGNTFWNALDDVISPRIKKPEAVDESALSIFRSTFQGRDLKKGTYICLTWVEPSKMLVSTSFNGLPSKVDATIESLNVALALFDAFLGNHPVSPSLKLSVSNGFM